MLNEVKKDQVLFLDVETVPLHENYDKVPERQKKFWDHKASFLAKKEDDTPAQLYERAGIYSEFGKIVCISSGYIKQSFGENQLHIKSFYGDDEKEVLQGFLEILNRVSSSMQKWYLCAHNGKEFDFPYIARRLLVNGLPVPSILDVRGKFARDIQLIDTMELWKFGDYKSFVSLDLLANIFGIPSPKTDMDGSMVRKVYYEEKNLEKIAEYCSKDVITLARVFMRFKNEPDIDDESIRI